jgi:hypothetical protein
LRRDALLWPQWLVASTAELQDHRSHHGKDAGMTPDTKAAPLSDDDMDHLVQQTRTNTACTRMSHGEMVTVLRWMEANGQTFTPMTAATTIVDTTADIMPGPETGEMQIDAVPMIDSVTSVDNAEIEGADYEPEPEPEPEPDEVTAPRGRRPHAHAKPKHKSGHR